jgi:hypothetical protein
MRLAKAPQGEIDKLRIWMQFNDELCKIDPTNDIEWESFKSDWEDEEDFQKIIKYCEDDEGFSFEYYLNYYNRKISHIHMRIIFGYETLVDNICDPELDYLDFNKDLKKVLEKD